MEENINISERIDRYILNLMSEEERKSFEGELASNQELNKEFLLQQEIALATQRVHLKHHFKNIEANAGGDKKVPTATIKTKSRRVVKIISTWSIAAAVVCVLVIGFDIKYSSDIIDASNACYTEMGAPLTRSGNEIDELLAKAYQHIGENQFSAAYENIHSAEKLIMEEFISQATTEEELYINKILTMQKEDAEWYKVLILMKEGHIFKSRKALKSIANSESRYAEKAKEILEEYLF